jgi:hypothetical protein
MPLRVFRVRGFVRAAAVRATVFGPDTRCFLPMVGVMCASRNWLRTAARMRLKAPPQPSLLCPQRCCAVLRASGLRMPRGCGGGVRYRVRPGARLFSFRWRLRYGR